MAGEDSRMEAGLEEQGRDAMRCDSDSSGKHIHGEGDGKLYATAQDSW